MFTWNDDYSVGIPVFDFQHKRLFEIGRALEIAVLDYNKDEKINEVVIEVKALLDYTFVHFSQEEMMMRSYDYPETESHINEHKEFMKYLSGITLSEIQNNTDETMNEIIKFIAKWIIDHINGSDRRYSDYLRERMENPHVEQWKMT